MRSLLVTGSDTAVGKTQAVAALARMLAADGARVQIVKVVETGVAPGVAGDAERARRLAGVDVAAFTLAAFPAPLAPAAAAAVAGQSLSLEALLALVRVLPACDWRILEGAGGIATPVDATGRDWADFADELEAQAVVVVVADRLGAINQARLSLGHALTRRLHAGVWLNATEPVDDGVGRSTREGLRAIGVPIWAEQGHGSVDVVVPSRLRSCLEQTDGNPLADSASATVAERCRRALLERDRAGLRRALRVTKRDGTVLNLADNDYLALTEDPAVVNALADASRTHGSSASASPLITGWREAHATLVAELCEWHRFPAGLLWTSGYAANTAVLGALPVRGDLVLADRLIHHSMIAGLLRSGARLKRYDHLRLDQLETLLAGAEPGRSVFVVTESVFSMDGDFPDLVRMAALKKRHRFCWIVDEAHALGWYGPEGAGLVRAAGVEAQVDVLVGTLGKTLAAGGAYTLFRDDALRDYLVNFAGEFIYSTALPPANAAAASAALARVRLLAGRQAEWHAASRAFRVRLRAGGWAVPDGDSPIVPVSLNNPEAAVSLAADLARAGIIAGAVRPPTVPAGTSRLRFSLKRTFGMEQMDRVLAAMERWRAK